jgi:hypothetical protein
MRCSLAAAMAGDTDMPDSNYQTKFGSLAAFEKGGVQNIDDDVRNYAFSNCFEIASKARPYERVVFGQNQTCVLETVRPKARHPRQAS